MLYWIEQNHSSFENHTKLHLITYQLCIHQGGEWHSSLNKKYNTKKTQHTHLHYLCKDTSLLLWAKNVANGTSVANVPLSAISNQIVCKDNYNKYF